MSPLPRLARDLFGEYALETRRRGNPRKLRSQHLVHPNQTMLNNVSPSAANISTKNGIATADHLAADLLKQSRQRRAIDADIVSIGDETALCRAQVFTHRAGKGHQHQRAARDYKPGIDLLAFDHIPALESFLETLLCRFFCFIFVFAEFLCHARSRSATTRKIGKNTFEISDKPPHHCADHQ